MPEYNSGIGGESNDSEKNESSLETLAVVVLYLGDGVEDEGRLKDEDDANQHKEDTEDFKQSAGLFQEYSGRNCDKGWP